MDYITSKIVNEMRTEITGDIIQGLDDAQPITESKRARGGKKESEM